MATTGLTDEPVPNSSLISNRYQKYSKMEFSNDYPTKPFIGNSVKTLQNEKQNLVKDYIQKTEMILEDSDILMKKSLHKIPFNNPKLISKSHPLKPIILEKSQSTQENSKILTDNENEFLENGDNESQKTIENDISANKKNKNSEENKNWGAMFTFYNKNSQISKEENNESFLKGEEEAINRKTGNFKIISKTSQKFGDL